MTDTVESPAHYAVHAIEPIDFIMGNDLPFWKGNIVKYTMRAGYKVYDNQTPDESQITDLLKVIRYAEMQINYIEGREPSNDDDDDKNTTY